MEDQKQPDTPGTLGQIFQLKLESAWFYKPLTIDQFNAYKNELMYGNIIDRMEQRYLSQIDPDF